MAAEWLAALVEMKVEHRKEHLLQVDHALIVERPKLRHPCEYDADELLDALCKCHPRLLLICCGRLVNQLSLSQPTQLEAYGIDTGEEPAMVAHRAAVPLRLHLALVHQARALGMALPLAAIAENR